MGLRGDLYTFSVTNSSIAANAGHRTAGIVSPKASFVFSPSAGTEVYLSGGLSFHSNDARGTTIRVDPVTGEPVEGVDPLVRSRGAEIGVRVTPVTGWRSTVSAWGLKLDGELLFVGDAGITEPSSPSRRIGVTFANFYRATPQLTLDADVSLARARFAQVAAGEDRIPGAIENVIAAGVAWSAVERGPFGAVRLRHFGSYPLIEDNGVRSTPSTLVGVEAGYLLGSGLRIQATVLNLFDTRGRRHPVLLCVPPPRRAGRRGGRRALPSRRAAAGAGVTGLGTLSGLVRHLVGRERRRRPTEPSRPGDTPAPGVGTPPRSSWCSTKSDCRPTRQGTLPTRIDDQAHEAPVRHPCQAPFPG